MLSIRGRGGSPRPGVGRVTPMHSVVAVGGRDGCLHLTLSRGWVSLGSVCGVGGSELAHSSVVVPAACAAAAGTGDGVPAFPVALTYDASEEPSVTAVWSNGCTTVYGVVAWSDGYRLCEPLGWGVRRRRGSSRGDGAGEVEGEGAGDDGGESDHSDTDDGEGTGDGAGEGDSTPDGDSAHARQAKPRRRPGTDPLAPTQDGFAVKLVTLAVLASSHGESGECTATL
jgi:hypothetical protein